MNSMSKIESSPPTAWAFAQQGPIPVGSAAHRDMFCRMLLDTFDPYKPEVIDWPKLAPDALARLVSLPFWTIAVETEDRASANIAAFAKSLSDPLMREAVELIAYEEARHRRVLSALVDSYGIKLDPFPPHVQRGSAEWNFMSTGYGECLDSFFAFGLFELAKRSGYFPMELVETFEPVIQEEARHIVFFVNWAAYMQANTPLLAKPWFAAKRLAHLGLNGLSRAGVASDADEQFATQGKDAVGVDIEIGPFMDMCLSENDRRMAHLDARLLRPTIMPTMVRFARRFMPG